MSTDTMTHLGWDNYFQAQLESCPFDNLVPARVIGTRKNSFRISTGMEERLVTPAGRLYSQEIYPVAGDFVLLKESAIYQVLVRKNALSRGASGNRSRRDDSALACQVIAANLDTVCIVTGLDRDFNLRRIERYLTLVYNCGLNPVVVLTKADLSPDPDAFAREVSAVAFGVPVHLVSAADDRGLSELSPYLCAGRTITLVGSSGAGKSTLVNRLSGQSVQVTRAVSQGLGKGRHTTTTRDLIHLPRGGMIIDNPGIREIAFWENDGGADSAFPDIERLGRACRFDDCTHTREPGCRVLGAVDTGELPLERLENYRKMQRELSYLIDRRTKSSDRLEKERWKKVTLKARALKKRRF